VNGSTLYPFLLFAVGSLRLIFASCFTYWTCNNFFSGYAHPSSLFILHTLLVRATSFPCHLMPSMHTYALSSPPFRKFLPIATHICPAQRYQFRYACSCPYSHISLCICQINDSIQSIGLSWFFFHCDGLMPRVYLATFSHMYITYL